MPRRKIVLRHTLREVRASAAPTRPQLATGSTLESKEGKTEIFLQLCERASKRIPHGFLAAHSPASSHHRALPASTATSQASHLALLGLSPPRMHCTSKHGELTRLHKTLADPKVSVSFSFPYKPRNLSHKLDHKV